MSDINDYKGMTITELNQLREKKVKEIEIVRQEVYENKLRERHRVIGEIMWFESQMKILRNE